MNRVLSAPGGIPTLLLLILLLVPTGALAQDDDEEEELEVGRWYRTLEAGLLLTQSSFSDNWAGGDSGQLAWAVLAGGSLKNQMTASWLLHNTLTLAYGKASQEDENGNWSRPRKITDRIDFESILRGTLGYYLDPYAAVRVESQFEDASDPLNRGSRVFNPVVVKESFGVAHDYLPQEDRQLLVRFGGALRQTFRSQYETDDPADDTTVTEVGTDGGVEFVVDYNDQYFDDKYAWTSKLTVYQPLFYSSKSTFEDLDYTLAGNAPVDPDVADYTTTVDVDWENVFTAQVSQYIDVNLYVRFVYDKYDTSVEPLLNDAGDELTNAVGVSEAIRKAGQFKQTLALGLTYRFF